MATQLNFRGVVSNLGYEDPRGTADIHYFKNYTKIFNDGL